jgi:Activator of Hsp90 ATPase homolog 1-like protein/Glutathione S-transferase, N-terminal domain
MGAMMLSGCAKPARKLSSVPPGSVATPCAQYPPARTGSAQLAEGAECDWGKVLVWEPPTRVLLAWQLNGRFAYDPEFLTEVELTFAPASGGGSLVTMEHRNLEGRGDDAEKIAGLLGGGWPTCLAEFVAYADSRAVLATLEEKGADYRLTAPAVGMIKVEPHISRHPFGRVPVLEHDGFLLYETQAMMGVRKR